MAVPVFNAKSITDYSEVKHALEENMHQERILKNMNHKNEFNEFDFCASSSKSNIDEHGGDLTPSPKK